MKKIYLSCSLLFVGFLSQAQINKGTILLGGNFEYGTYYGTSNPPIPGFPKSTELNISPAFGKAVKDDLVLGFSVSYGHNSSSQAQQYNDNSEPDQTTTGNNLTAVSSLTGTNELSVGLRYLISRAAAR
jgi:hypothetical protein